MRLPAALAASLALTVAAALACGGPGAVDPRPLVVVSVVPQAYFVERLAGERVRVVVMVPPGASPATWEPTLAQLRAVSEASLYVKVGHPAFPFEVAWLAPLLADRPSLRVLDHAAGQGLGEDPHIWVSPAAARDLVDALAPALADLLGPDGVEVEMHARDLRAEIDAVARDVGAVLQPLRGRPYFVLHPAWGHLTEPYGLEQVALEPEGKEPDAHALGALVERARGAGARVLLVQPQLDPASARALASEIGARVETLDPLARDWPANLRRASRSIAEAAGG